MQQQIWSVFKTALWYYCPRLRDIKRHFYAAMFAFGTICIAALASFLVVDSALEGLPQVIFAFIFAFAVLSPITFFFADPDEIASGAKTYLLGITVTTLPTALAALLFGLIFEAFYPLLQYGLLAIMFGLSFWLGPRIVRRSLDWHWHAVKVAYLRRVEDYLQASDDALTGALHPWSFDRKPKETSNE